MPINRFQLPSDKMQNLVNLASSGKFKAALKGAKQFEKLYPKDPALKNFIGVIYAKLEMEALLQKHSKEL